MYKHLGVIGTHAFNLYMIRRKLKKDVDTIAIRRGDSFAPIV